MEEAQTHTHTHTHTHIFEAPNMIMQGHCTLGDSKNATVFICLMTFYQQWLFSDNWEVISDLSVEKSMGKPNSSLLQLRGFTDNFCHWTLLTHFKLWGIVWNYNFSEYADYELERSRKKIKIIIIIIIIIITYATSRQVAGSNWSLNCFNFAVFLIFPATLVLVVYSASNINEYQREKNNVSEE
jgi:hypothetical protein